MKFLIIGVGSIGQRHAKNLQSMGHEIIFYDPDEAKLSSVLMKFKNISNAYSNIDKALQDDFDAGLICSPTTTHIYNALKIAENGKHIFIEKPISHNLENIDKLQKIVKEKNLVCFNACNIRYLNIVKILESLLNSEKIGKILSVNMNFGFYLPYWHPNQNYTKSYSAKMGDGVIFDTIHELDILMHLFGDVSKIFCNAEKISDLEIETEDNADILANFSGIRANIHFDYIQKTYKRVWEFIGTEGEIILDIGNMKINIYGMNNNEFQTIKENINYEINNAYIDEMQNFINCINLKYKNPNDIQTAKKTLIFVLNCHKSAKIKIII